MTGKKHGGAIFRQEPDWYDYWSNEKYEGGQYVTVEAPIDRIPVFVKAGAVIPVADGLVYAQQEPKKPIQLWFILGQMVSLYCMRMKETITILKMARMQLQRLYGMTEPAG